MHVRISTSFLALCIQWKHNDIFIVWNARYRIYKFRYSIFRVALNHSLKETVISKALDLTFAICQLTAPNDVRRLISLRLFVHWQNNFTKTDREETTHRSKAAEQGQPFFACLKSAQIIFFFLPENLKYFLNSWNSSHFNR